jgi:ribosomal-protein-alanine N-acetyltransferase
MILDTERLTLREFTEQDIDDVQVYASDPLVVKHMIWGPNSIEDTKSFINMAIAMSKEETRQGFELAVVHKGSNKVIGGCGIHITSHQQGEIGYCFSHHFWGNGFATEAANALLRFGFRELALHRIYATCRPDNIGSAKVLKKVGMYDRKESFL